MPSQLDNADLAFIANTFTEMADEFAATGQYTSSAGPEMVSEMVGYFRQLAVRAQGDEPPVLKVQEDEPWRWTDGERVGPRDRRSCRRNGHRTNLRLGAWHYGWDSGSHSSNRVSREGLSLADRAHLADPRIGCPTRSEGFVNIR